MDCNRAFSQARQNLEDPIRQSNAIVTGGPLPTVVADEVMLVQVFQNLIGNAIRYRSEAAPEIHVSAVRAGDRWLFSVRDNGIGVERADAERIFAMFSSPQGRGRFRYGNRTRTLQESGGASRRTDLGGIEGGARGYFPVYDSDISGCGAAWFCGRCSPWHRLFRVVCGIAWETAPLRDRGSAGTYFVEADHIWSAIFAECY